MNATARGTERDVVLASADAALRQRLRESLTGLRWRVHEASGGAEALTLLEHQPSDALLMDGWLPDLEAVELASHIAMMYPAVDVLSVDGGALTATRSAHRNEITACASRGPGGEDRHCRMGTPRPPLSHAPDRGRGARRNTLYRPPFLS